MTELKTLKDVIDYIDWLWEQAQRRDGQFFDGTSYIGYSDDNFSSSGDY